MSSSRYRRCRSAYRRAAWPRGWRCRGGALPVETQGRRAPAVGRRARLAASQCLFLPSSRHPCERCEESRGRGAREPVRGSPPRTPRCVGSDAGAAIGWQWAASSRRRRETGSPGGIRRSCGPAQSRTTLPPKHRPRCSSPRPAGTPRSSRQAEAETEVVGRMRPRPRPRSWLWECRVSGPCPFFCKSEGKSGMNCRVLLLLGRAGGCCAGTPSPMRIALHCIALHSAGYIEEGGGRATLALLISKLVSPVPLLLQLQQHLCVCELSL